MKLPGSTLIPCRNQIPPISTSSTPTMLSAIFIGPPAQAYALVAASESAPADAAPRTNNGWRQQHGARARQSVVEPVFERREFELRLGGNAVPDDGGAQAARHTAKQLRGGAIP